ncbi:uncharacterized protein K441DRAFT_158716 [Cenococcum geophilum 1.58]|uniref:uncharacterized protein n=1 Tax=Cenococcum geophilum 1.58 TaxID=794803 RepID=UPI00358E7830|nr:hypothetical protein K441DRAFT_158716 [Cenococcum geophilum 1.58]
MFVYSHRVAESQMCCFIIYCSNGDGRCNDNMICFFSFLIVNTWVPCKCIFTCQG